MNAKRKGSKHEHRAIRSGVFSHVLPDGLFSRLATPSTVDAYLDFRTHARWSAADKKRVGSLIELFPASSPNQGENMDKSNPHEIAFENLPASGIHDYAVQVAELYESIVETYEPVERAYRAAVEVHDSMNGFSSSTNI